MIFERKQEDKLNSSNTKEEIVSAVNSNFESAAKQKNLYIRMESLDQNTKEKTPYIEKPRKLETNPLSLLYKRFDFGNSPSLRQALKHKKNLSKQQQSFKESSLERVAWTPLSTSKTEKKKIDLIPSYADKVNYHLQEEFQKRITKKPNKRPGISDNQSNNASLQENNKYETFERQNIRLYKPKAFSIHRNQSSFIKENSIIAFIGAEKKGMEKSQSSQLYSHFDPQTNYSSAKVDRGTSTDFELERTIKESSQPMIKPVYKEPLVDIKKSPKNAFDYKKIKRHNIKMKAVPGATRENGFLKMLTPQSKTRMFFLNENNSSFLKSEFL